MGKTGTTLTVILGRNPTLAPAVKNHLDALYRSDVSSRYHALEALAELGPSAEVAVPAVGKALREDCNIYVRKSAAWALGRIGRESAVADLRFAVDRDENKFVREVAEEALKSLGQMTLTQSAL